MMRLPLTGPPLGLPFELNRASPQAVGLVGWFPALASAAGSIPDLARGNRGTSAGGLSPQPDGTLGQAWAFDGTDDQFTASGAPYDFTTALTVAAWIYDSSSNQFHSINRDGGVRIFIIRRESDTTGNYHIWKADGGLVNFTPANSWVMNQWFHCAITAVTDGTTLTLSAYVNGQLVGSTTNSGGSQQLATNASIPLRVGGDNATTFKQQRVADVRIYNRALSAAEIWSLYAPQTRWDLYSVPPARAVRVPAAAGVITDSGVSSLPAPAVLRPRAASRPQFTAVLYSPQAEARAVLSGYGALSCTVDTTGDGGGFEMDLPPTVDRSLLKDGSLVVVYKKPPGGVARYKETYIVLGQSEQQARRGTRWPKIEGPSLTSYLLGKDFRIVNALENETGASVTATAADDAIRYFINGALAAGAGNSGTSLGRDLSTVIGLTVETNRSVGPAVTHNGYLQPLDSVVRAIAKKAEEDTAAPMRIRWQVKPKTYNPLTFEVVLHTAPLKATTRLTTRKRGGFGVYRGFDAPAPVILGPAFGTVVESDMERDRTAEYTSVVIAYASKANRTRATDSARALDFPLAFREVFYESTVAIDDAGAQTDAAGKLKEGEAREVMRVKLLDSAATRYDAEYGLGDVVGVLALDRRWEAEIVGEENTVDRGGVHTSLKLKEED